MRWLLALVVALGAAAAPAPPGAQPPPAPPGAQPPLAQLEAQPPFTPADGQRLAEALAAIVANARETVARQDGPRVNTLTERGINAYLRFQGAHHLPPAVGEPEMRLLGDGRLSARALIDLDRLRAERPRGPLDPLRYLGGQVEVVAAGALRASAGVGRFEIESLHVESVPVPVLLLVEVVRTHRDSGGFDLTAPFPLPYGIEELRVEPARAIVVQ